MKLKTSWTGADLAATLRQLAQPVRHEVAVRALSEAAEPMRAEAASLAPRGHGKGPHLADNIVIAETTRVPGGRGRWRDSEDTEHVVAVGPSFRPDDVYWGLFQELGTAHHSAHPFLRPAFDHHSSKVMEHAGRLLVASVLSRLKGR